MILIKRHVRLRESIVSAPQPSSSPLLTNVQSLFLSIRTNESERKVAHMLLGALRSLALAHVMMTVDTRFIHVQQLQP